MKLIIKKRKNIYDVYKLVYDYKTLLKKLISTTNTESEIKVVKVISDVIFFKVLSIIKTHSKRTSLEVIIDRISFLYETGIQHSIDYISMNETSVLKRVNAYIFM